MSSVQCSAKSRKSGERCKNKTHRTYPCCWQHTINAKRGAPSSCAGVRFTHKEDHPDLPVALRVRREKIGGKDVGYGLFVQVPKSFEARKSQVRQRDGAKLVFLKGEKIAVYSGKIRSRAELDKVWGAEDELAPYALQFVSVAGKFVDANDWRSGVARYANDCCANKGKHCACDNVIAKEIQKRLYFIAKRNIYDGDAIHFKYGAAYWKSYREELKKAKAK